jgi:hypothetical protein
MQAITQQTTRRSDSFDDRHIMAKHAIIYPTTEEVNFHLASFISK